MVDQTLVMLLEQINRARALGTPDLGLLKQHARDPGLMKHLQGVETRLAVYGSLAPGEVNHHHLVDVPGRWSQGHVRGHLAPQGWGEHVGFPGMTWDPNGDPIAIQLFTSIELPAHWERLDAFEGSDYQRILAPVELSADVTVANIYAIRRSTLG